MEKFIAVLRAASAVMPTLEPVVAAFVPQLAPIIKVAELVVRAGGDAAPQAALVLQILGGNPLTDAQRGELDATYERLRTNLHRPLAPPPEAI